MPIEKSKFFASRFSDSLKGIADDTERSHKALKMYYDTVLKLRPPMGQKINFYPTDGSRDGGLDGYVIDKIAKKIFLFQTKWYASGGVLSETETKELLSFITDHLLADDKRGMKPDVQDFISKYPIDYKDYELECIILTISQPNLTGLEAYGRKGIKVRVVGLNEIGTESAEALSKEEFIENKIAFILGNDETISIKARYPIDKKGTTMEELSVLQCVVRGLDIKRAHDAYKEKLFLKNIRLYLGDKKTYNKQIKASAESPEVESFYVLHNGISIVCKDFLVGDEETLKEKYPELGLSEPEFKAVCKEASDLKLKKIVILKNFQIVNGAQSTQTIASLESTSLSKIQLPCKITKTRADSVMERITVCNNTQNPIDTWDLVANNPEHTLMQNFAALIDPPIFYQRKEGEKWVELEISKIIQKQPEKYRVLDNMKVYQSYLAFKGYPSTAYSNPGKALDPFGGDGKKTHHTSFKNVYNQIKETESIDVVLMSGLIWNYEKAFKKNSHDKGDVLPEYQLYWDMWVIASFGHLFKIQFTSQEREKLKTKLIGIKGVELWREIREFFNAFFDNLFKKEFANIKASNSYQPFYKNGEKEWNLPTFNLITPNAVWPLIDSEMHLGTFKEMVDKREEVEIELDHYDLNFAILARLLEQFIQTTEGQAKMAELKNKLGFDQSGVNA